MKKRSKKIKRVLCIVLFQLMLLRMIPYVCADENSTEVPAEFTEETESVLTGSAAEFTEETESVLTEPAVPDTVDAEASKEPEPDSLPETFPKINTETTEKESDFTYIGSISGTLWYDENSDGWRDDGEAGIANYPVSLYKADSTDNAVQTMTTDAEGNFTFSIIEQNVYVVGIKSEKVNGVEYLLPLGGIKDDNELIIDALEENSAYSEAIAVQADSNITGINAGMRTAPLVQSRESVVYDLNIQTLTGTAVDNGVTVFDNVAVFSGVDPSDTYVITGKTDTNTIVISSGEKVNLTLRNVDIRTLTSPIQLLGMSIVDMTLSGENTLYCTDAEGYWTENHRAGLYVDSDATLTIGGTSNDTLSALGGGFSAGIGGSSDGVGGNNSSSGTINITGGMVTAWGDTFSSGIGGGLFGDGGIITISGGAVSATGGDTGGAGIGGGYAGSGGTITISGGSAKGTGRGYGAGIGGGYMGSGGVITISEGTVTASGNGYGVTQDIGYGGSGSGGTVVITGGSVLPVNGSSYVNHPTNGAANGSDKVGMITLTSLSSQSFSFVTAGSAGVYTYAGTGHKEAGYLWMTLPGVTTNAVSNVSTTPAVVTAPDTVKAPASSVATLNGTFYLNNTKPVTNAYFQWGSTPSYGVIEKVAGSSGAIATAMVSRSVRLTDLQPGTTYYYRFVIVIDGNTIYGDNMTFTTPAPVPSVDATHNLTGNTTATLYGIYDLNGGIFTGGEFMISTTGASGPWITLTNESVPAVSDGTGVTANTAVLNGSSSMPAINLINLKANTYYYYKLTVANSEGASEITGSWYQQVSTTDLKISKTVTGKYGDPNKAFIITVTLEDGGTPVTGSYAYTGSAISGIIAPENDNIEFNTSGQGTIKLKHGQAITIEGITQGYTYTVQETAAIGDGYTITYSGTGTPSAAKDSISETLGSTTAIVYIINERISVPVSGLNEIDYRSGVIGFTAVLAVILVMLWCYRSRRMWK